MAALDKEGLKDSSAYQLNDIGSALDAINHTVEMHKPIVTEAVFIRDVLPLLQHPWSDTNIAKWLKFVHHEPMQGLRVAGRGEGNETVVLFTVPGWFTKPGTSIPKRDHATTAAAVLHVRNEVERGNLSVNQDLAEFLDSIAARNTTSEELLLEIALILARYDKTFTDAIGNPLYELGPSVGGAASKAEYAPRNEDTFISSGFEDED